jgi:hypothetical protein
VGEFRRDHQKLCARGDPLDRKPPTLRKYSADFLEWVNEGIPPGKTILSVGF